MSPLVSSTVPADQWVAEAAQAYTSPADMAWGFYTINFMDSGHFALG